MAFAAVYADNRKRSKRWVYDSGTRVPLIIRFPNKRGAGTTNDELISFIDFVPTMLSLAGLSRPGYLEGQVFHGAAKAEPRHSVFNFNFRDRMDPAPETIRAVRDRRFGTFEITGPSCSAAFQRPI